jgi:hypothetical protein
VRCLVCRVATLLPFFGNFVYTEPGGFGSVRMIEIFNAPNSGNHPVHIDAMLTSSHN